MSVQYAGAVIREARQKAGLSQEKLSDGICSVLSLSRIENGTAGVSPSTFQALMAHTGFPCDAFPIFANRTDFDCFYTLKRAKFYLDCWQLNDASKELNRVESIYFAKNKFYYQEWLLLHCNLQFRSGCGNHSDIYHHLIKALHISQPDIDFSKFVRLLLSPNEIELLISIAQEALYLNMTDICLDICTQIFSYLENCQLTLLEKRKLLAKQAVVYTKYLIANKDYISALSLANSYREKSIKNNNDISLHELTFLAGLANYHCGNSSTASHFFKMAFFSAHSIGSCYATSIQNYLSTNFGISLVNDIFELTEIPFCSYTLKQSFDISDFSDGTYDLFSPETLTLGSLIRELRTEQHIPQQTLCYGLCSKSKLSKIENNTLQPDIALSQSLLQRLGISDIVFTFFGSEHETMLQDLKVKLSPIRFSDESTVSKYVNEMQQLCSPKDTFYLQYASYKKANHLLAWAEREDTLLATIKLSLPEFSFNNLPDYRLSWLELTILNNYCNACSFNSPSKGTLLLYKLLDYYNSTSMDILEKKRIWSIPLCYLSSVLLKQKRYSEITELSQYFSLPELRCSLHITGIVLGNYAQALVETGHSDKVSLYAHYAYYNLLITNSVKNAELLKESVRFGSDMPLL